MTREVIGIAMMITAIIFAFVELPFGFCRDREGNATYAWWTIFSTLSLSGFLLSVA